MRKPEIVVISDVHLGTYGCHAEELALYLKSIEPEYLIINGDFIDIWNFSKNYFPSTHMDVIRAVLKLAARGTKVIYITGNHDDLLRRYSDVTIGNITLTDKFLITKNGQQVWFFHGDIFDAMSKGTAKFVAKLGGKGYDLLILFNRFINKLLKLTGKEPLSFSKKIKERVKKAVSWIDNFEQTSADLAIEKGYDFVVCGHIHQPQDRIIKNQRGEVRYLNSGDWVENLTSLEFAAGQWKICTYNDSDYKRKNDSDLRIMTVPSSEKAS